MCAPLLCLVAALSAAPSADSWNAVYDPDPAFQVAIRGQTEGYDEIPAPSGTFAPQGTPIDPNAVPYEGQPYMAPGQGGGPWFTDPYSVNSNQNPTANLYSWGIEGPKPYVMGWVSQYAFGFLPKEETEKGLGQFGIFEIDAEWKYATPSVYQNIFSFAQQFSMRGFDGPTGNPPLTTSLPGEVYHIGWDFEFSTPVAGPWYAQFGFNPSINSDFKGSLSSDAWNLDARAIAYYQQSPTLTYALGAGFWDRVDDRVVPYAGVIYTPNNRWEYKLVFPEPSITYYGGTLLGFHEWFYVRGEWHVEAYELQLETTGQREQVELEDWRVLIGNRKTNGLITLFVEAGYVFGRDVEYKYGTPGFDVSSGFIVRAGLTY